MRFILLFFILTSLNTFGATSNENRTGLQYQAALGLGRLEIEGGYALRLARFIDEDSLIGVDAKLATPTDFSSQKETSFNLNYKRFMGNSFYLNPKIYYVNWSDPRVGLPERSLTSIGVGMALGNQWQWDRFTLGVDWLSVSKNLIFFKEEEMNTHWYLSSLFIYFGWSWN